MRGAHRAIAEDTPRRPPDRQAAGGIRIAGSRRVPRPDPDWSRPQPAGISARMRAGAVARHPICDSDGRMRAAGPALPAPAGQAGPPHARWKNHGGAAPGISAA